MNICIAQKRPIKGDIQANLERYKKFINLTVAHRSNIIIFPELSLTSYEPGLAKALATNINDSRLDCMQVISNNKNMIIGVYPPVIVERQIGI